MGAGALVILGGSGRPGLIGDRPGLIGDRPGLIGGSGRPGLVGGARFGTGVVVVVANLRGNGRPGLVGGATCLGGGATSRTNCVDTLDLGGLVGRLADCLLTNRFGDSKLLRSGAGAGTGAGAGADTRSGEVGPSLLGSGRRGEVGALSIC
jgi:hypothetical protein